MTSPHKFCFATCGFDMEGGDKIATNIPLSMKLSDTSKVAEWFQQIVLMARFIKSNSHV